MKITKIQKQLVWLLIVFTTLFQSGCVAIFGTSKQKVYLTSSNPKTKIYVNDKVIGTGTGSVKLKKKDRVAQVKLETEGYKTQYRSLAAYKPTGLILLDVPFILSGIGIYALVIDAGNYKGKKYPKRTTYTIDQKNDNRTPNEKFILLNKTVLDRKEKDTTFLSYSKHQYYMKNKPTYTVKSKEDENFEVGLFTDKVNDLLKEKGYIDTINKIFPNYSNTLYLNASISNVKLHSVYISVGSTMYFSTNKYIVTEMDVKWEVLNYYENVLYTFKDKIKSGEFVVNRNTTKDKDKPKEKEAKILENSVYDALNNSFLKLVSKKDFNNLTKIDNQKEQDLKAYKELSSISIPRPDSVDSKINMVIKSGVTVKTKDGHGSGFFISKDGYIITNYHVIAKNKSNKITVIQNDGSESIAEVVRYSEFSDLALLKIKGDSFNPLYVSVDDPEIGNEIWALGTPKDISLGQTVSKGIVSGIRNANDRRYIQTDVNINSGNSGGALISKGGIVYGVVTAKLMGYGTEGISFSVPSKNIFSALKLEYVK